MESVERTFRAIEEVDGKPFIAGTQIHIFRLIELLQVGGYTPEEIVHSVYPELTLQQVQAALQEYQERTSTPS